MPASICAVAQEFPHDWSSLDLTILVDLLRDSTDDSAGICTTEADVGRSAVEYKTPPLGWTPLNSQSSDEDINAQVQNFS